MARKVKNSTILVCIAIALIILSIILPIVGKKNALKAKETLDKMEKEAIHETQGLDK